MPIMLYGGIGIYTSYKNLESIEAKITGFDQEIYAYNDLYGLVKKLIACNAQALSRVNKNLQNSPILKTAQLSVVPSPTESQPVPSVAVPSVAVPSVAVPSTVLSSSETSPSDLLVQ